MSAPHYTRVNVTKTRSKYLKKKSTMKVTFTKHQMKACQVLISTVEITLDFKLPVLLDKKLAIKIRKKKKKRNKILKAKNKMTRKSKKKNK